MESVYLVQLFGLFQVKPSFSLQYSLCRWLWKFETWCHCCYFALHNIKFKWVIIHSSFTVIINFWQTLPATVPYRHILCNRARVLSRRVWELLMAVPTNPTILQSISKLSSATTHKEKKLDWEQLLQSSTPSKLIYSLQVSTHVPFNYPIAVTKGLFNCISAMQLCNGIAITELIGYVNKYPTMHYFRNSIHTKTMISYMILTEYLWKFLWKFALWEYC